MSDWIGILFLLLLLVGAFVGVRALANQKPRTTEEFEKNAAENTTMAGALLNALHDVTDPASQRAKEVRMQMKDGRYQKKRNEGKAGGDADTEE
jgi:Flp pilus assembly protein TadB